MNVGVNLVNYRHCRTDFPGFSGDATSDNYDQNFLKLVDGFLKSQLVYRRNSYSYPGWQEN
jgi:hypothetical protein